MVTVFDVDSGDTVFTDKSGPDPIFDLTFSQKDGCYDLWSAGVKHFAMWVDGDKKKGIWSGNPSCSQACVTADDNGKAYSGGANALIYVWQGRNCI